MCGIWSLIELNDKVDLSLWYNDFMKMKQRGPDMSTFQTFTNFSIGFHRLAIMNPDFSGNQPYILEHTDRTIIFLCNGEIYDFNDLIKKYDLPIYNNSDCMTIPQLYLKFVDSLPTKPNNLDKFIRLFKNEIKGEFAFILFELDKFKKIKEIIVARDTFGVRPLYYGNNKNTIMLSSEIKGMNNFLGDINEFEPGFIKQFVFDGLTLENIYDYDFKNVFNINQYNNTSQKDFEINILKNVKNTVIESIKRRLSSDRPTGFLLSGGVDSSLVCSISSKLLGHPIRTFCCGMKGGTDLKYAKQVSEHIGSFHTEVIFTPEEALSKIRDVIRFTETYDTTSIRASIGQHIVCEYISKNTDIKVLLVGEGSDECCGSYATFWSAPNASLFHDGCVEYLKEIHYYDGRRVDRNVSGFGLEPRLPLLDTDFIKTYHKIPDFMRRPQYKGIEKYWLRAAFENDNILPKNCLFRKKEAFSDGISSTDKSWFEILQEYIETKVLDDEFKNNKWNCKTKEAYYYKKIFCEIYGEHRLNVIPHYWQPKFLSNGVVVDFNDKSFYIDPSARILSVYKT